MHYVNTCQYNEYHMSSIAMANQSINQSVRYSTVTFARFATTAKVAACLETCFIMLFKLSLVNVEHVRGISRKCGELSATGDLTFTCSQLQELNVYVKQCLPDYLRKL